MMKRLKNLFIFSGLLLLVNCDNNNTAGEAIDFQNRLVEVVNTNDYSGNQSIAFGELTTFKWDSVHIFGPYTPSDIIFKRLGFRWDKVEDLSIQSDEINNLLVFTRQNKLVEYVEYPRYKGDFINLDLPQTFSVEEANFVIKEEYYGSQKWLFFYPKIKN
ncbi:MAG: hypothetical protein WD361_06260 [Gracilimonas sp.]